LQGQRDGYEQAKRVYMAAGEAGVALAASDALAGAVQRVEACKYISTIGVTLSYVVPKATVIALIKGDSDA